VLDNSARRAESTIATEELQHALGGGLSSRPPRAVRILVVDDHEGFRSSMVQALDLVPDVEVAGEARSGDEACEIVLALKPDVVLLDLSMPGLDGLEVITRVREVAPDTGILVFSGFAAERMSVVAHALGADGYLEKGEPLENVRTAVRDLAEKRRGELG
jgi:DNA-binding NarL/FixJ family response regulator